MAYACKYLPITFPFNASMVYRTKQHTQILVVSEKEKKFTPNPQLHQYNKCCITLDKQTPQPCQ